MIMKRTVAVLLLCLYTLSVSGAAVHLHFCGDHLIHISLFHNGEKGCCKGEMPVTQKDGFSISKRCCHNEVAVIKVNADHSPGFEIHSASTAGPHEIPQYTSTVVTGFGQTVHYLPGTDPPPLSGNTILVLIRNFRI